jgi:DEAD/DEAH box helicase domain-containing protein
MRHIAPIVLLCDVRDIGVAVEDNVTRQSITSQTIRVLVNAPGAATFLNQFEPNIYIYDCYPNGIGFSQVLYEQAQVLLEKTIEAIERCSCKGGCPSCIGPVHPGDNRTKETALFLVRLLLDRVYN